MILSIIIVTFNPGEGLKRTIESIFKQTSDNYELVVKDAGSTDGSIEWLEALQNPKVNIIKSSDLGIYDAMNQAVTYASGDFIIFMNAGDKFYSNDVVEKVEASKLATEKVIAYGDTYFELSDSLSKAPSKITGSVCYRNIPCHQSIVYSKDMVATRGFDTIYKIRADFEHFMWAFYNHMCDFVYLGFPICSYEGGGFSETKQNQRRDKEEYKRAVKKHIPLKERFLYRTFLIISLHKLRGTMARNPRTAKFYQKIKGIIQ